MRIFLSMYLQLDFSSLQKQQEYCFCGETTEPWLSLFMQNQFCSKITYVETNFKARSWRELWFSKMKMPIQTGANTDI